MPQKRHLSLRRCEARLGHDYGPRMSGAVNRCCQRFALPKGPSFLAAVLCQSAADADTALGLLERFHNRRT